MSFSLFTWLFPNAEHGITSSRTRLYGLCIILALSVLLMARLMNDSDLWAPSYLPATGITMLVICIAGAECQLFLQRLAVERVAHQAERERSETEALDRQRTFNIMWQALADARGETTVPAKVMEELGQLFAADLVAVWKSAPASGGFHLCGTHPANPEVQTRLDKIAHASPCFDKLRTHQRQLRVSDFKRETSPGFAWFCEENELQHAVLCPVLVRNDLVGVLVFFYRQAPKINNRLGEEMNAAANLFLCAL